ncbi:hypothetical protein SpiGrapes_0339 [Sphaerochaeta pleomorpha str. Grapes]|uniref:Uncharacterized protein n=1 Tax=Sphaerochaeta pleomorpha (strain ATCC BAA-1885 / DSM 22778 / Grapes) TaxID=158190 RepID=G8QVG4_SPHPG|nr:hypothetical protein [Sphaerochaeta pleomorpha]AEV28197.1 hypothetical protein SpiGrapes_0339 [Sphaerochaeta pleomorpha str. Grapes]
MYCWICIPSDKPFYNNRQQAKTLLLSFSSQCQNRGGALLDYTLEPNRCRFLAMLPQGQRAFLWKGIPVSVQKIEGKQELLVAYAILSEGLAGKGKYYELCGTFEAFHKSDCFCLLGKISPLNDLPSFKEIIDAKNQGTTGQEKTLTEEYPLTVFAMA